MKPLTAAALLLALATASAFFPEPFAVSPEEEPIAECASDSECAELCPQGTRDLPADHPDYCDGGPA